MYAPDRSPVVAGQFYPDDPKELAAQVGDFLKPAEQALPGRTRLAMVPHAGYVYSGAVAGKTLGAADLAETILLLGPNHTGQGSSLAVWNTGSWLFPGGELAVDDAFAEALLRAEPRLTPNQAAHLHEHSLEVLLPFLAAVRPGARIVPIAVAEPDFTVLEAAGAAIAGTILAKGLDVSVVVSSDMSHYISHDQAQEIDAKALEKAVALDPDGLYETVRDNNISMCGVLPMTLGLIIAKHLGAKKGRLVTYATSGDVNRDYRQVVGYAGVLVN